MSIKSQLSSDLPLFFNQEEFAVEGTYTTESVTVISDITVNFEDNTLLQNTSKKTKGSGVLHLKLSDVPTPFAGDKFDLDGVTWRIERVFKVEFGVATLEVRKDSRSKFS